MKWMAIGLSAYLCGCIPTGYLLGRFRGIDIRALGSGNIGATNVFRCLGRTLGTLTLLVDFTKGLLPVLLARKVFAGGAAAEAAMLAAVMAVVGHVWPVTLGFKGGKGVATAAGAITGVVPAAAGLALAVWAGVFLAGGYVSLASMTAALAAVAAAWVRYPEPVSVPAAVSALALITLWRHRANLARLRAGNESRFRLRHRRRGASDNRCETCGEGQ